MDLQHFWADQGCVIWQPYHTQVGAGTMNPATYLRVLGPEPWQVAYVEPSIRPDDARYGENPNRLQRHYQFQVILKPDPGNPQEIYLQSLLHLGIDPAVHDIRFVEDNWEQPALGAWGLGWEVWLDGQEITQFTYFQQAGGIVLDPVSVEMTYGLERILIALNGLDHFTEIPWDERHTYGDLNLGSEQEYSRYYFEIADVTNLWEMFSRAEAEANGALAAGLVLPAHDYVLQCSHLFNLLDTRGAVGVTERAGLFNRMREMARGVAEAYLAQRQAMGFPWLAPAAPAPAAGLPPAGKLLAPAEFVLEIGTEELPAGDLASAIDQLRLAVPTLLETARLAHQEVRVMGTPRRLAVLIEALSPVQSEQVTTVKGPPAERAFTADGKPTPAAQGFARSRGLAVEDLQVREMEGGRYVVAEVRQAGGASTLVLAERLPGLIAGLKFERTMRWEATGAAFSRPIRWLVALHGDQVVPFEYAGLQSGRQTRGLRLRSPETYALNQAPDYLGVLRQAGVILDPQERRGLIAAEAAAMAAEVGGECAEDGGLLAEVTNLVESPAVFCGSFAREHLTLPQEVLIAVMKKHQRYFPVTRGEELLPHFLGVRNGDRQGLDTVVKGNEHVLRARYADAAYFVRRDLERPFEAYREGLSRLTFQTQLGSMLDKTQRVEALVEKLAPDLGLTEGERRTAMRAAHLCKADLMTEMVVEMTSLQGVLGAQYALQAGEPVEVAQAIREHYLPRHADDDLPASRPGMAVAVADRLDTLVGLFAVGLQPTGTRDPFALRRAAIGLIHLLTQSGTSLDLRRALELAGQGMPVTVSDGVRRDCLGFIAGRQESLFGEGRPYDVVAAVLAAQGHNPASALQAIERLAEAVRQGNWPLKLQAYARCVRIVRGEVEQHLVDAGLLREPAEAALLKAVEQAEAQPRPTGSVDDFLCAFDPLVPVITRFFDEVLVMAEEPGLRKARLGLLQHVAALADGVADLSRLEGF
ncbi:MAG: glycine--tRNA ligase subunit beta [Anaerolineales bacterium]|nr:glycine--tRNA ligase subunit beta [Anaerolineales bacterium]